MQLLAIDLDKQSFHIHGISSEGEVISKKVTRSKLEAVFQELAPATVAMEVCASAHRWGRQFEALGGGWFPGNIRREANLGLVASAKEGTITYAPSSSTVPGRC